MLNVAFAGTGTFPANLEQPVRRHLTTPCEIIVASEIDILSRLAEIDVLVTMGLTTEMAHAAPRLKLVQVPGAGLDRIDRSALPDGALLANVYGHEVGIAEYVIGAMLTLTRECPRLAQDERTHQPGCRLVRDEVLDVVAADQRQMFAEFCPIEVV